MSTYSVADAKSGLPCLIDRALNGEKVVIARHGKPVVEFRPIATPSNAAPAAYLWLKARRKARTPVGVTSVELIRQIYEDPDA